MMHNFKITVKKNSCKKVIASCVIMATICTFGDNFVLIGCYFDFTKKNLSTFYKYSSVFAKNIIKITNNK